MARAMFLDCDPGHDDAVAILLALTSTQVDLCGITTVAGNQTLEHTTRNALVVLSLAGRQDVPVAKGAAAPLRRALRTAPDIHGDTGLDGAGTPPPPLVAPVPQDATTFLTARVTSQADLVATGPLTNVALALARGARPRSLVWMGGGTREGDVTETAEFNAYVDPEAAAEVLATDTETVMVGLDVTHRALVGAEHRRRLRAAGTLGAFVARLLDYYGAVYRDRYGWPGPPLHDALAVAVAIDPTLVRTEHVHVRVHLDGAQRGRTEVIADAPPNVHVAMEVDVRRFLDMLCSRLEGRR